MMDNYVRFMLSVQRNGTQTQLSINSDGKLLENKGTISRVLALNDTWAAISFVFGLNQVY